MADLGDNINKANQEAETLNEKLNKSRELFNELIFSSRDFSNEVRQAAKEVFNNNVQASKTVSAFKSISKQIESQTLLLDKVVIGQSSLLEVQKEQIKLSEAEAQLKLEASQALSTILGDEIASQENITKALSEQNGIYNLIGNELENLTDDQVKLLNFYDEQIINLTDIKKLSNETADSAKKIDGAFGLLGGSAETVEGVLKKIGGSKLSETLGLSDAISETKKYAANLTKGGTEAAGLGGKFKVATNFVGHLGKNLLKSLGPVYLISELIQGIMQADKEVTELQKSMALSQTEAMGFRTELALAAADTGNINVTTEKLLKNFNALNQQFGFITNFSAETLATMTRLTDVVKIGSESAGNLAAASSLTGKSFDENYKDILATSYELQRQSGVQFDLGQILEETGKVTGTVRANLGANPALIAEAVTEAKLFGGTLKDVAGAAEALVGFQSSIRAELEAELLTGKQLNLERARMAALTGDQATLARELKEQAGGFEDFTKMNVIQQQALAKSLGMQSDQLADILFQQEIQGKSARELRALGKEDLAQRVETQNAAEKFNATIDKLKGLFSDVGTAFLPVLKVLGAAASLVGLIVGLVVDLLAMLGGDFDFSGTKAGFAGIVNSFKPGTIDIGDGNLPSSSGPYTITSRSGQRFNTDPSDNIQVSPNPGGLSPDMSVIERKLDQLIAVVREDKIFALDGKQFAVATAVSRS